MTEYGPSDPFSTEKGVAYCGGVVRAGVGRWVIRYDKTYIGVLPDGFLKLKA